MSIRLKLPYKIIQRKHKRYLEHYQIPAEKCVVVPLKEFGDDLSCNVHWEDSNGVMQQKNDLFFNHDNLEPLDPMKDFQLHEIWQHYYSNTELKVQ